MKQVNSKIILNIEIENIELISQLNILSQELSISLDQLILYSIEKILIDIKYLRKMRR